MIPRFGFPILLSLRYPDDIAMAQLGSPVMPSSLKAYVRLNKSKNLRKTRKWVGRSSPNTDFLCMLFCTYFRKMDGEVGEWENHRECTGYYYPN